MRNSRFAWRAMALGVVTAMECFFCSCTTDPASPVGRMHAATTKTKVASTGEISVGSGTLDKIPVNQFNGLNWGYNRTQPDLGNYSRGTLRLPLLDTNDAPSTVVQKTNTVLDNFLNAGANTIRLPVNIQTVNNKWTSYYHYVVTTALNRNFKIILCFWLDATNKLTDMENIKTMWHTLAATYFYDNVHKIYPLVFYELANEPCGYQQNGSDYLPDIKNIVNYLENDFPGIKKRIIVGGTDYSAYPGPVAVDAELQDCYLAVHFYETWAHDYSTTLKGLKYYPKYYDDAIVYQISWRNGVIDPAAQSWYNRIIMTEYGQWTDRGYGYTSKTAQHTATSITPETYYANDVEGIRIAYIYGTGEVINRLQLGSVMWGGLIADGYSLFDFTTSPVALSRKDYSAASQLFELTLPLRAVFWGPKSTTGTYAIDNLSPRYSLTTDATNGKVALSPSGGIYYSGTQVTLTASPDAGYGFSGWGGDASGSASPVTITMNSNKSVVADFVPRYALTAIASNGTINLNPSGGSYNSGTVVALTASPAAGYLFSNWTGDCTGSANPVSMTMNANKSVTAVFIPAWASDLAWKQVSNGWGPVEKDKSNGEQAAGDGKTMTLAGKTYAKGFGCHAASEITVPLNKNYTSFTSDIGVDDEVGNNGSVTFQAVVDGVTKFTSAKMTGASATQTVTIDVTNATTLTLKIGNGGDNNSSDHADWAGAKLSNTAPLPGYSLTTSATNGSVSPAGGTYTSGTVVTLTATPAAGYVFSGWSGDLSGTANPSAITMNANKSVTAAFTALPQYTLSTSVVGSGTVSPAGGSYYSGTVVTLTATASAGYTFTGWSGDLAGTASPATITMNSNKSVIAAFAAVARYTLTTSATNGTVSPSGGTYNSGTVVTLTATPAAGYAFSGWSGDLSGTVNPATVTMSSNKNITANFALPVSAWASDLAWKQVSNGWGPVEKDKSNGEQAAGDGKTMTLAGKTYTKGFGCHAASEITVPLNKNYTSFTSDIGVDDEVGNNGSVTFQVAVDGVTKFTSAKMTGASATQTVTIDVTNATTLTLKIGNGGDNNSSDHADWAGAKVTR